MSSVHDVLKKLAEKANPENVKGMARYGMTAEKRMGVSVPNMRTIAKEIGKNHELALELWKTGIPEAKIVASMVAEPKRLTEEQMGEWVKEIDSWDVCDQVCMNLFEKSPLALKKILDWSMREEEFVKRAAYSLLACLTWHDKKAEDEKFIKMFPVIRRGALDERNYVRKAVNWALRNIGKRNVNLNKAAIDVAREIHKSDSKAARWIATDAIRELECDAVQKRLKK